MAFTPTIVVNATGRVNTPPATILAALLAAVQAVNPGYTATLPGSLIEDISSTDVAAAVICDQALTDLINSLTPYAANPFLLAQLGILYGIPPNTVTNTSVYVTFTGTAGFVINQGFIVSDGTYQYTVQDGGIIPTSGPTVPLYCLASQTGIWAVPAATVTTLVTSVPGGISLAVTNPLPGTPSAGTETEEAYRARVLEAGLSPAQGMGSYLKSLVSTVPGVQARLVSVRQESPGWEVLVGGGDPYQVAYAIWTALFDVSNLQPSTIAITGITNANPGVATTNLNHGLTTGQTGVHITGVVGMTLTGGPYTVIAISPTTFSFGVNTTSLGAWTSGGVVTPNPRNITANVIDSPDTYTVAFVSPPAQTVLVGLTWNTTSPFIVSATAVAQLGAPAIASYINSIGVGQAINQFELINTFQLAVVGLVPTNLLSRMVWTITINGVATSVTSGTGLYVGDPESYFTCASAAVTITQG